jgi:hypothetical protein
MFYIWNNLKGKELMRQGVSPVSYTFDIFFFVGSSGFLEDLCGGSMIG